MFGINCKTSLLHTFKTKILRFRYIEPFVIRKTFFFDLKTLLYGASYITEEFDNHIVCVTCYLEVVLGLKILVSNYKISRFRNTVSVILHSLNSVFYKHSEGRFRFSLENFPKHLSCKYDTARSAESRDLVI